MDDLSALLFTAIIPDLELTIPNSALEVYLLCFLEVLIAAGRGRSPPAHCIATPRGGPCNALKKLSMRL
jgi:hypothetical protein